MGMGWFHMVTLEPSYFANRAVQRSYGCRSSNQQNPSLRWRWWCHWCGPWRHLDLGRHPMGEAGASGKSASAPGGGCSAFYKPRKVNCRWRSGIFRQRA